MSKQDRNRSTRKCPICKINPLMKNYNPTVDGRQVCTGCATTDAIDMYWKKRGVEA